MKRQGTLEEISDGKLYSLNDMVKADCGDCEGCSACCRGMGTSIILDPMDIYRMTAHLGTSFEKLLTREIELNVVDGVILPNSKMSEITDSCMFLIDGRCSIHAHRPGVCRLFPLGRYYSEESFSYFLQIHECLKQNRTKTKVQKWIDTPQIKKYEPYITRWHYFLKNIQDMILDGGVENRTARDMNLFLLNTFYMKLYDGGQDFYEQFYERLEAAKEFAGVNIPKREHKFDKLQQEF